MNYFYLTSEGSLLHIPDFRINPGARPVTPIRSINGQVHYMQGRKQPDTFIMLVPQGADNLSDFRVVDSDAKVYGCLGHNTAIINHQTSLAGTIYDRWEPEELDQALKSIRAAEQSI
jgi:hypothetical protein